MAKQQSIPQDGTIVEANYTTSDNALLSSSTFRVMNMENNK